MRLQRTSPYVLLAPFRGPVAYTQHACTGAYSKCTVTQCRCRDPRPSQFASKAMHELLSLNSSGLTHRETGKFPGVCPHRFVHSRQFDICQKTYGISTFFRHSFFIQRRDPNPLPSHHCMWGGLCEESTMSNDSASSSSIDAFRG